MARACVTSRVTAGRSRHDLVKRPVKRVSATLYWPVAVRSATMRATDLSGLGIYLLGKPRVERDGEAVCDPRGYKVWGLLAYLLRTDRPPPNCYGPKPNTPIDRYACWLVLLPAAQPTSSRAS